MPAFIRYGIQALCLIGSTWCAGAMAQSTPAPFNTALREQVVMVPKGNGLLATALETTVFRPPGEGPFPVVVINHGKESGDPRFQARARYEVASRAFLERGYMVVLPMRQGFSKSTGSYIRGGCNITSNGRAQAEDITAALAYVRTLPDADSSRIVVAGQSHGGLSTMALGALPPPEGVRALINFAGGLRNDNCTAWEAALSDAFASYGKTTQLPSLWFYGSNDSFWPEALARDMHARFVASGGQAKLVAFGHFGKDAHQLFSSRDGLAVWLPEVEAFLAGLGLPAQATVTLPSLSHERPLPAATHAFALDDADAIPHVKATAREGYRKFLAAPWPRAFAIASTGAWAYIHGRADAMTAALTRCTEFAKPQGGTCQLYAVDDRIVWPAP